MNDWIEINLPYYLSEEDNFTMRGLAKPGVLIRMEDESEYLIGDINPLRGVCDDCTKFDYDTIVKAYKVVWSPENEKPETTN